MTSSFGAGVFAGGVSPFGFCHSLVVVCLANFPRSQQFTKFLHQSVVFVGLFDRLFLHCNRSWLVSSVVVSAGVVVELSQLPVPPPGTHAAALTLGVHSFASAENFDIFVRVLCLFEDWSCKR